MIKIKMRNFSKTSHGQSAVEIVVLIMIIAAAVLAMNRYVRRAIMARLKESGDSLGEQFSPEHVTKFNVVQNVSAEYTMTMSQGGVESKVYDSYVENRVEEKEFDALNKETLF